MPAIKKPVTNKAIDHVTELVREVEDLRSRNTDEGLQRRTADLKKTEERMRGFKKKLEELCLDLQTEMDALFDAHLWSE